MRGGTCGKETFKLTLSEMLCESTTQVGHETTIVPSKWHFDHPTRLLQFEVMVAACQWSDTFGIYIHEKKKKNELAANSKEYWKPEAEALLRKHGVAY